MTAEAWNDLLCILYMYIHRTDGVVLSADAETLAECIREQVGTRIRALFQADAIAAAEDLRSIYDFHL